MHPILLIVIVFSLVALPFVIFHDGTWATRLDELKPKLQKKNGLDVCPNCGDCVKCCKEGIVCDHI